MADANAGTQGAMTGAAAGATVGSAVPGIGTAVGAIGGAVIGGVSGLFGGGGSKSSGYTLPPEYELQYIQQFQDDMARRQADYQGLQTAYDAFDQKIGALNDIISRGYTPQAFQQIQQSNFQLTQALGKSGLNLAENDFLTKDDQNDLQQMMNIAQGDFKGQTSPVLEGQLADQKRQLEQDLTRQGLSPTQRLIALNQFEQNATQQRFNFAQQQFGLQGQVIGQRAGLRQQGFNQATNSLGSGMNMASQYMGAYGQLGQNYGAQYSGIQQMFQGQSGLRQEGQAAFQTMGQFKFSNNTKDLLAAGRVGPGSFYQQTGIDRGSTSGYRQGISGQEQAAMYGTAPGVDYSIGGAVAFNHGRMPYQEAAVKERAKAREEELRQRAAAAPSSGGFVRVGG